ncbi:MAG: hypothetical protein ACP5OU_07395, partial [Methanothrix sp.]
MFISFIINKNIEGGNRVMKSLTIIGIILILGVAGASQYPFGTKVTSVDTDFGSPLRAYGAPNPGTYFSIG